MDTTTSGLLAAALGAAERGWHVFPLRPDDKRPAFPDHAEDRCAGADRRCRNAGAHVGWQERATTDPDRIRRAWAAAAFNVGIACGPSGLLVVDLDMPKPGQHRPDEWAIDGVNDAGDVFALICDQARTSMPIDTHTVTTGRGGTHHYYQHLDNPRLRNTSGTLGWLIDTRGWGGYVVAAGSTVGGRPYTTVWDVDPAPLPAWLGGLLTPVPRRVVAPTVVRLPTDRRGRYVAAAIRDQVAHLSAAPTGQRNHVLFASAVALGQLAAGGHLTETDVVAVLEPAAVAVGLPAGEVTRTITSGMRVGMREPRHLTTLGEAA